VASPRTAFKLPRGIAWAAAITILVPFLIWQFQRSTAVEPLPVLYTLGGDFALDSTRERTVRLSDFRGQTVLLNFGFTSCPEVCPTALSRLRDVLETIPQGPGGRDRVQPLFITLDPSVDTVDRMAPYLEFFDAEFIGLTGSEAAIASAAADYKVHYERETMDSEMGYTISHSAHIYLIDAAGRVRATFGQGVTVPSMARTVQQLLGEGVLGEGLLGEGALGKRALTTLESKQHGV
jgi:protein SCO1/2